MNFQTIIVPLLAAIVLTNGCAITNARLGNNEGRDGPSHSNESYYGVIDSIESGPDAPPRNDVVGTVGGGLGGGLDGAVVEHPSRSGNSGDVISVTDARSLAPVGLGARLPKEAQAIFIVRIRFDDRSYQTVSQASLDGLRVGDGVRIEDGRVRRY
jgi:outer membrane lipoprotein SlyB